MSSTEEILSAALALSPENRAAIAEQLLDSLDEKYRREIDAAWTAEAERRLEAYRQGRTKAIPGEEVFRSLLNRKKA